MQVFPQPRKPIWRFDIQIQTPKGFPRLRLSSAAVISEHGAGDPNQFREGPGLKRTTARRVGRLAVRDFGNVAEPALVKVFKQRIDES
jgi:hypothetical protein